VVEQERAQRLAHLGRPGELLARRLQAVLAQPAVEPVAPALEVDGVDEREQRFARPGSA
jgi:hypothetical protein